MAVHEQVYAKSLVVPHEILDEFNELLRVDLVVLALQVLHALLSRDASHYSRWICLERDILQHDVLSLVRECLTADNSLSEYHFIQVDHLHSLPLHLCKTIKYLSLHLVLH